jgi:hypothetical protein
MKKLSDMEMNEVNGGTDPSWAAPLIGAAIGLFAGNVFAFAGGAIWALHQADPTFGDGLSD